MLPTLLMIPEAFFEFEPTHTLILAELARIKASSSFRRAHQLQRLLSHIVEAALAGEGWKLHEINLALECFRRSPSRYDPHQDSIVRVAANRLRRKLDAYYENEGLASYLKIELPIGGYMPKFVRQQSRPSTDSRAANNGERGELLHQPVREHVGAAARDLYDHGRFALRQQGTAGYRKAIELFERATRLQPRLAEAWSGLAVAFLGLVGMVTLPSLPDVDAARAAVLRALEIDPQHSEAYAALASIIFRYDLDFARAEPLYRQAIQFGPSSRYAHHAFAFALTMNARFGEADAEYQIARDLDPLDQTLRCQHALMPMYTGDYVAAESALLAILDVDQNNILARSLLGATYLYHGHPAKAMGEYQRIIEQTPKLSIGWCGRAQSLAMLGLRKKARAVLQHMIEDSGESFVSPYQVAMVHSRLGDEKAALDWLDRAAAQRDANFICAPVDPAFAELRARPGWQDLMQRHGLAEAATAATAAARPLAFTPP